jgi:hypothetical protein
MTATARAQQRPQEPRRLALVPPNDPARATPKPLGVSQIVTGRAASGNASGRALIGLGVAEARQQLHLLGPTAMADALDAHDVRSSDGRTPAVAVAHATPPEPDLVVQRPGNRLHLDAVGSLDHDAHVFPRPPPAARTRDGDPVVEVLGVVRPRTGPDRAGAGCRSSRSRRRAAARTSTRPAARGRRPGVGGWVAGTRCRDFGAARSGWLGTERH